MTDYDCLADAPIVEDEEDPDLHDKLGFDHSGGPGPLVPGAAE